MTDADVIAHNAAVAMAFHALVDAILARSAKEVGSWEDKRVEPLARRLYLRAHPWGNPDGIVQGLPNTPAAIDGKNAISLHFGPLRPAWRDYVPDAIERLADLTEFITTVAECRR